jgi:hypothetical protein
MQLRVWRGESEEGVVERRRQLGVTSSVEPRCNQARQSCRKPYGCAGRVSVSHVREQKKAQLVSRKTLGFAEKSV